MEDLNVVDSINHAGTWLARNQELLLSYAVNSGQATDDETVQLARWEEYRLAVSRVDTTATDIVWPEKP